MEELRPLPHSPISPRAVRLCGRLLGPSQDTLLCWIQRRGLQDNQQGWEGDTLASFPTLGDTQSPHQVCSWGQGLLAGGGHDVHSRLAAAFYGACVSGSVAFLHLLKGRGFLMCFGDKAHGLLFMNGTLCISEKISLGTDVFPFHKVLGYICQYAARDVGVCVREGGHLTFLMSLWVWSQLTPHDWSGPILSLVSWKPPCKTVSPP